MFTAVNIVLRVHIAGNRLTACERSRHERLAECRRRSSGAGARDDVVARRGMASPTRLVNDDRASRRRGVFSSYFFAYSNGQIPSFNSCNFKTAQNNPVRVDSLIALAPNTDRAERGAPYQAKPES